VIKPTKYLRKEAVKAEIAAGRIDDPEISTELLAMADAYRSQAEILKKNKKVDRKRRAKTSQDKTSQDKTPHDA
jgi:single-stranded DNA-specific DHH superfamily exonuclease